MKYSYSLLLISCFFFFSQTLKGQSYKWELDFQFATNVYNPAATNVRVSQNLCDFVFCHDRLFQPRQIRDRRLFQLGLNYRMTAHWSIQANAIIDYLYLNIEAIDETGLAEPFILYSGGFPIKDWLTALQLNYQPNERWRFSLGSRFLLGPDDSRYYSDSVAAEEKVNNTRFYPYFQTQMRIPIKERFGFSLGALLLHKEKWYLKHDIQLEANIGTYFKL